MCVLGSVCVYKQRVEELPVLSAVHSEHTGTPAVRGVSHYVGLIDLQGIAEFNFVIWVSKHCSHVERNSQKAQS